MTKTNETKSEPKLTPEQQAAEKAKATAASIERRGEAQAYRAFLAEKADILKSWCRDGEQQAGSLIRCAELAFRNEVKLRDPKTWPSIYLSLIAAAQLDLEPAGPLAEAHIVPFWDKKLGAHACSLMPGYRGFIKLAIQSGQVTSIRAQVVHENDPFHIYPADGPESLTRVEHEICLGDRGKEIGVYALARMKGGGVEVEWMSTGDVERIMAQAADSPAWKLWADQMARKSVIKRLCKQLPLGERYFLAARLDDSLGDLEAIRQVLDINDDGTVNNIVDLASRSKNATRFADKLKSKVAAARPIDVESKDADPAEPQREMIGECPKCGGPHLALPDGTKRGTCDSCWGEAEA